MSESYPLDQYITISCSDDKLNAYLSFSDVDERFSCTMQQLEDLLQSHVIKFGVQYDVLSKIAANPQIYFTTKTLIATGESPTDGADGYIKLLYDLDDQDKKPAELEDGKVDYREVTQLKNVRKGQRIAERVPAKEGKPGRAVTGEPLYGKSGKEARFKIGKNVVVDPEQTSMYASIDGLITKTDRDKINVFPIYEVNGDVDYNVGNIDFVGTVVIRGNVLTGFKIRASGDVRVIGGIEGADIEAEGSVEVSGGIIAHNKGSIKAGKNVKCSFMQEANVTAGEDVLVAQSIMHSQVRAGRNVFCNGPKGLIVGGTIQAGEKVTARTIGNTMSTVTVLEVGVLPELRNELTQLRVQLKSNIESLEKTEKALGLLDQMASAGQLAQDKIALRMKLSLTKRQTAEEQSELRDRIFAIEKTLEDTSKAKIEVISMIYGGVKIVIGRYTRFIKDSSQRVTFRFHDGDIVVVSNV